MLGYTTCEDCNHLAMREREKYYTYYNNVTVQATKG